MLAVCTNHRSSIFVMTVDGKTRLLSIQKWYVTKYLTTINDQKRKKGYLMQDVATQHRPKYTQVVLNNMHGLQFIIYKHIFSIMLVNDEFSLQPL